MLKLRSEEEIVASWKYGQNELVVSICCITYNHEHYIKNAIEGFLIQETDFPFEILIHDDASIDRTADIIREYESKYPKLIKPIYQIKNQWSKGLLMNETFNFPRVKGQYIALCEGDDYWTSAYKLQLQLDKMKQHPELSLSFHPACKVDGIKLIKNILFSNYGNQDKVIGLEDIILGNGCFMPTASIMLTTASVREFPAWFNHAPVGDYFLQVLGSKNGGALYIKDCMSIYRCNIKGSWSSEQEDARKAENFLIRFLQSLDQLNLDLNKKYISKIEKIKQETIFDFLKKPNVLIQKKKKFYNDKKYDLSLYNRFFWFLVLSNPGAIKFLKAIYKTYKKIL